MTIEVVIAFPRNKTKNNPAKTGTWQNVYIFTWYMHWTSFYKIFIKKVFDHKMIIIHC